MKVELSAARVAQSIYARSLVYFAAVAETGSIRESSRQLNISPSALSRQLTHLHERLGVKLFDNLGHSLRLAPAGEELLQYYRSIVTSLDATVDSISALHGNRSGTVRITAVDSFANTLLARMLADFSDMFPSIQISLSVQMAAEPVAQEVLDGTADIGFTFNLRTRDSIDVLFEAACPMGIVVARGHPLAAKTSVTYEECVAYPIGLLKSGGSIRAALEQASMRSAMPWPKYIEATSMRFLDELAMLGRHVVFQPRYRFAQTPGKGALVFVPMADSTRSDEFVMIVDSRLELRPAPSEFARYASNHLASLPESAE
jgi:DNA-binding transcriptional LysR family regulator